MYKMSNYLNKIYPILCELNSTLNLSGLGTINKIFSQEPEIMSGHIGKEMNLAKLNYIVVGQGISIHPRVSSGKEWFVYGFEYPNRDLKTKLNYSFKRPKKRWISIKSVVICSEELDINEMESQTNPLAFYSLEEVPIYISLFCKIVRKHYKSSYIDILDNLPNQITYFLSPNLNLKHHKLSVLKNILYAISDFEDEDFLNNTLRKIDISDKPLEECIDSIIEISDINSEVNYNCCLGCGRKINIEWVFCDATTGYKSNRDNCRNKYRYWQSARLGINNLKRQKEIREQHAKELKELVMLNPFGAFERFKRRHPELYEQRYNQRWAKKYKDKSLEEIKSTIKGKG